MKSLQRDKRYTSRTYTTHHPHIKIPKWQSILMALAEAEEHGTSLTLTHLSVKSDTSYAFCLLNIINLERLNLLTTAKKGRDREISLTEYGYEISSIFRSLWKSLRKNDPHQDIIID